MNDGLGTIMLYATVLLLGCGGSSDDGDPTIDKGDATAPAHVEDLADTGFIAKNDGQLVLQRTLAPGLPRSSRLLGLYVDDNPGYSNLAACAILRRPCIQNEPTEHDTYVDIDPEFLYKTSFADYNMVGLEVSLGPYVAPLRYDETSGMAWYEADLGDIQPVTGWLGTSFGVEWGTYVGTDDLYVSEDIELIYPNYTKYLDLPSGLQFPIEWVPTGEGEVMLHVQNEEEGVYRLYWLNDDGFHLFDVDALGLGIETSEIIFTLSRQDKGQVLHRGNTLDLMATSSVVFAGRYFDVEGRDELELSNTCEEAVSSSSLVPGTYWGHMTDFSNNMDGCTGVSDGGREGLIPVSMDPWEYLSVQYQLLDEENDPTLYVMSECDEDTCILGRDDFKQGETEILNYFNQSDLGQTVYLAFDADDSTSGLFYADVTRSVLDTPELYDSCVEVQGMTGTLPAGVYYTDFVAYGDDLNPGAGGCTGTSVAGGDAMTRIGLQIDQEAQIVVDMPGGDPAIYLVYSCNNDFSCVAGSDRRGDNLEVLSYMNLTGQAENLYLIIDTPGAALRPFFLTLDIY